MDKCLQYVSRIRNPLKRAYALRYLQWRRNGEQGESPDRGALSYMAAQAVEMSINQIEPEVLNYNT